MEENWKFSPCWSRLLLSGSNQLAEAQRSLSQPHVSNTLKTRIPKQAISPKARNGTTSTFVNKPYRDVTNTKAVKFLL